LKKSFIRLATDTDMDSIRSWLIEEASRETHGNFLCNWEITMRNHRDRRVLVYIDGPTQKPVAYQWGGLIHPGILQVQSAYRRRGIGKKLAMHCMSIASKKNECLLFIKCKPSSSVPFWQSMGFTMRPENDGAIHAYKTLPKLLELPKDGTPIRATIRFFPEEIIWNRNSKALVKKSPKAQKTNDGIIHLGERVLFHREEYPDAHDVVIELKLNGRRIHFAKTKHKESIQLGVKTCSNGYFIDRIWIPRTYNTK